MPISHTNYLGQTYYLHEGKTRSGKPKYYISKKAEGNPIESIPDGYEIYERPDGLVVVRKIPTSPILPHELKYVQDKIAPLSGFQRGYDEWCDELGYTSEFSDMMPELASLEKLVNAISQKRVRDYYRTRYVAEIRDNEIIIYEVAKRGGSAIMKFTLYDEETRKYGAYRWGGSGLTDRWLRCGPSGQLMELVDEYCPMLGTDEFYELGAFRV